MTPFFVTRTDTSELSLDGERLTLTPRAARDGVFAALSFEFPAWEEDAYVFLPAAVYDGNRVTRVPHHPYPPVYRDEDIAPDAAPVMSNVPGLDPDGGGKVTLSAGDLALPCVGVFFPMAKRAFFLFTEQELGGKNVGFRVTRGRITLQLPVHREKCYRLCRPYDESYDTGLSLSAGVPLSMRLQTYAPQCGTLSDFFNFFFRHRRCVVSGESVPDLYTPALYDTLLRHLNTDCFHSGRYGAASGGYQCGWVGGPLTAYALDRSTDTETLAKVDETFDFLAAHVCPAGFFFPNEENGVFSYDGDRGALARACLVRKQGDALCALLLHTKRTHAKDAWLTAARGCLDALLRVYEAHQTFGLMVDGVDGSLVAGRTAAGASVISALVLAAEIFDEPHYLAVAVDAGHRYDAEFVKRGRIYGGAGDALSAYDSESTYALLSAFVLLYERTQDKDFLAAACDAAHILSSYVMPYAYRFPDGSEMARLCVSTVGAVFANVQNKHAAPGLCTASGDALYRLYRYTQDEDYLTLLRDIVRFIPQCVSTDERPVYALKSIDGKDVRIPMPSGYINERVNTSDWETPARIGEVFYGSCWCVTALALTYGEIINDKEIRGAF